MIHWEVLTIGHILFL